MKIKLSKLACLAIGAATALVLYMSLVTPDIEKPVTVAGFYFLLSVTFFGVIALLTRARGRTSKANKPYVSAGTYTLAFLYLIALRSINTLDWVDVAIVVVVVTLIRQLLIVPKNN